VSCKSTEYRVNWNVQGARGAQGLRGVAGLSAYQVAQRSGFIGTQTQWLLSLAGADGGDGTSGADGTNGVDGTNGADGTNGVDGVNGQSAYEVAVANGFEGSQLEWLLSLSGTNGKSAFELAQDLGLADDMTVGEWIASLKGRDGADGNNGADGTNGADGRSAYELAKEAGAVPDGMTVGEWISSLKGRDGKDGEDGAPGSQGPAGQDGATGPQGPDGPKGEQGPKGESGAAATVVHTVAGDVPPGATLVAVCPPGLIAIGGGAAEAGGKSLTKSVPMKSPTAEAAAGDNARGWSAAYAGTGQGTSRLTVFALCTPES
jgi:hypothetical protein